jgi:hypothetical protein
VVFEVVQVPCVDAAVVEVGGSGFERCGGEEGWGCVGSTAGLEGGLGIEFLCCIFDGLCKRVMMVTGGSYNSLNRDFMVLSVVDLMAGPWLQFLFVSRHAKASLVFF